MSAQMNAAELNKLKKSELIERCIGLAELTTKLRDENNQLEGRIGYLISEKELLEQKKWSVPSSTSPATRWTHDQQQAKRKQLLHDKKSAPTEERLSIPKPMGQVDRDYQLHEVMTGEGRLEISNETYLKFLVSTLQTSNCQCSPLTLGWTVVGVC